MSRPNTGYQNGDWYDLPDFYDIVFDQDTSKEAGFLEAAWAAFGNPQTQICRPLRILEPACGSGRLILELANRGHHVEGFDANTRMLEAAKKKLERRKLPVRLRLGTLENPPSKARFDLAHCLLSTFKYIRTERDAVSHLQHIANQLVRGGIYVVGIHLTNYQRTRNEIERWTGKRHHIEVHCETTTSPPNKRRRTERLRNRLRIRLGKENGQRRLPPERIETCWTCRTYNTSQLQNLLSKIPQLECVASFDFNHDIDTPKLLKGAKDDIVVVLKKW